MSLLQTLWCGLGVRFSSLSVHLAGSEQDNGCFVSSSFDPLRNLLIWKNQSIFIQRGCLSLFKSLQCYLRLLSFMTYDDNLFLILYEKYWMSSCTTCQIRNPDTSMSPDINLPCRIVVNDDQDLSKDWEFFYQNDQSEVYVLPYFSNDHWTRLSIFKPLTLSSDSHSNTLKYLYGAWELILMQ